MWLSSLFIVKWLNWGLGVDLNLHSKHPFIFLNENEFLFYFIFFFFLFVCTKCFNNCFLIPNRFGHTFDQLFCYFIFVRYVTNWIISCYLPTRNRKREALDIMGYGNKHMKTQKVHKYMLQRVNEINYCFIATVTFVSKRTSFFWNF